MEATKLSPRITTMIRMDHTHVLATFHKYRIDASSDKKEALVHTICTALEIHAQLEEEIFYPAMRALDAAIVDKSYPDHEEMRRLIARLRGMDPGDSRYDDTVMDLMRNVIHHVADEETTLLPAAERMMSDRLEALGWEMTRRRFELAGPRAGEIAGNMARAYPGVVVTAGALALVGAFFAARAAMPATRRSLPSRGLKDAFRRPAQRLLAHVR